jgi:hypothetical protein
MSEQALRFGVASPEHGLSAASWKLWTPKKKGDVYLAARELGSAVKLSIHESGRWHFAYDPAFFESKVPESAREPKGRFIKKWTRPAPLVPGVTLVLRIITPWFALTPGHSLPDKVRKIEPPSEGMAREVYLILVETPATVDGWPGKNSMGTDLVGSYPISEDESIWAVHKEVECPDLSRIRGGPFTRFKGVSESDISSSLRAMVLGGHEDGSKVLYDLVGKRTDTSGSNVCSGARL